MKKAVVGIGLFTGFNLLGFAANYSLYKENEKTKETIFEYQKQKLLEEQALEEESFNEAFLNMVDKRVGSN